MSLLNGHECVGSYGTTESALAEISKLLAVQSPQEVILIGIGSPGQSGSDSHRSMKTPPSPSKTGRLVIHLFWTVLPPSRMGNALTPHETRVLSLLAEGHNYKTAAMELGVSVNTVSFHVRRIYEKLQVHSKSEAVAKALKNNLV
jgi:DNA-binding CsgD family transcriptional regulator